MQFAKLFTFPTGQLLLEREWLALGTRGEGYSSLVTTTKYQPEGQGATTGTARTVFPTASECEADFEAFDEARAQEVFAAHQALLRQGREVTFFTDLETPTERLAGRPYPVQPD